MASVRLENIHKSFPGVKALADINIAIESGEFFTLLGPSGCGKTTLLRTVAGFYQQDSGHVYVGDKLIDNQPAYARDTGMVFQNYAVFPHMTVFENVAFGLKTRKIGTAEIKERVARILEMARLSGLEQRTPDQLSGGQQQRVGLARAMVVEPQVLLMDEPLSNLDAKLRVEMREEIRDIQDKLGVTTIYVTHDQEEALVISDRIAVMNLGKVQQVATPWNIYKEPVNTFVASFVGNTNFLTGRIESRKGNSAVVAVGDSRITTPAGGNAPETIQIALRPEDLAIVTDSADGGEASLIPGTIEKSIFTGAQVRYTIACGKDLTLVVERHRPEREAIIPVGTEIMVHIPAGAPMSFHPETGERL
ncbi:MAG: ABC transporter ATP-binding protein [Spirochaetaceae bacterium]|nr:ABC transporter ATP-binding protein [Spirochaetaceae bacterium]